MILDGVVDPKTWVSYKVTAQKTLSGTLSYPFQTLRTSLADAEKTYSAFTNACAASGKAGCKLVELVGDGATGQDILKLLDDAHDVGLLFYGRECVLSLPTS